MALPAGIDPSQLPAFDLNASSDNSTKAKYGPIRAGLGAGFHELVGLGGSAIQGVGALAGLPSVAAYGKSVAANQNAVAARVGRPDLEVAPWQTGGASIAPWLLYQGAKLAPTLAGYGAATLAAPEAAIPAALVRAGATLPEFLGGAGLEAGAGFAARRAAVDAGTHFGKFVIGGGAFGGATGFGQAIQSADQKPGGVTASDALQAAAESPAYAAAGLLEPGFLRGALKGAEGNIATRVLARALGGSAVGSVQSGAMAALDTTFRPDLSSSDKFKNIVDAAVTGGAVGGAFGGLTGIRALKRADPKDVTNDDLNQVVDEALDLGQAGQNIGRLGLPAPTFVTDSAGRTINASEAAPTAYGYETPLDPLGINSVRQGAIALHAEPYDSQRAIDPAARASFQDIINQTSHLSNALPAPSDIADRTAVPGSTIVVGRRNETGRFTNEPTGVEQPPVVPEDTSRAFRNFTDDELTSAANALANKHEASGGRLPKSQQDIAQAISDELQFRRQSGNEPLTTADINTGSVEAVSANANPRGTGEQNSAAPASATSDISARVSELTQGLKLPSALRDRLAQARSENDIQDIVHDEAIVVGKRGKNIDALGERTGVLDDEGRPTSLADEISARKTPEGEDAPSPMFQREWKQDVQKIGQKTPDLRALNPTNRNDAMMQLYRALGNYTGDRDSSDGKAIEQLARKYGVLDDNNQLTPNALELAKSDPIPLTAEDAAKVDSSNPPVDATTAARGQGFKGSDISMFRRGVMAYTGEGPQLDNISSPDRAAAYQAGAKFAEDTNSVPKGALKRYEPPAATDRDVAAVEGTLPPPQPRTVPPEVRQGQLINEAIDNAGLTSAKHETEIAALKGMVRQGDIEGAMEGLRAVQRGEPLIPISHIAEEPKAFKGESATPGAPKTGESTVELVPTKGTTKAEAARAIRNYELGLKIDAAHTEGEISARDKVSLVNKLRNGQIADVIKAVGAPTGRITGRIGDAAARAQRRADLHQALQDGLAEHAREAEVPELNVDENGVLRSPYEATPRGTMKPPTLEERTNAGKIISTALDNPSDPHAIMRELIAQGGDLGDVAKRFEKLLPKFDVRVTLPGELEAMLGVLNASSSGTVWGMFDHGENRMYLNVGLPHPSIALHEIIHAVTGKHIEAKDDIGRQMINAYNRFKKMLPENDYSRTDAHEFMSEFISRKQVRDWVRSYGDGKGSVFQRIWDAVRKMLGMPPRDHVEHIFNLAEQAGYKPLDDYGRPIQSLYQSPPETTARVQDAIEKVNDFVDTKLGGEGLRGAFRRSMLYATTAFHIAEHFGDWFQLKDGRNGLKDRLAHTDFREAFQQRKAQIVDELMDRVYRFEHEDAKGFETLNKMMGLTQFGIHPGREWDQQIPEVQANPQLKDTHDKARGWFRSLQTKGKIDLYNDLRKFNDMIMLMQEAMALHDKVSVDNVTKGQMPEFSVNPARRFMDEQIQKGYGLEQAHKFWSDEVDRQTGALKAWSDTNETNPANDKLSGKDRKALNGGIRTVREYVDHAAALREKLDKAPYFHLGREGDYIVDMKLRLGADGKVDPIAMAEVAQRLKAYGDVASVDPLSGADHVFIRVGDTVAQRNLRLAAEQLQKEGVVRQDHVDENTGIRSFGIVSGKRTKDTVQARLASQWSQRIISEIRASEHLSQEDKKRLTSQIQEQAIDLLPDNSLSKVMSHRDNIPGFHPDMMRSYNSRAKLSIDAAAGMAIARDMTDAYSDMREASSIARGAPSSEVSTAQRNGMTEVADEMSLRDKQFASAPRGSKLLNQMQALSGAFFLSANLAYPAVNLAQVPMLALPRLGSQYGYVRSAKAMAEATPEAVKIIRAIAANGLKVSKSRAADAVVTMQSLKDAGITGRKAEFIMQVANRGGVDIGGASRNLARNARGVRSDKVDQGLRIASAMGYYSETLSRLVVGLAEYRLHDPQKLSLDEMADKTVATLKSSMWDYGAPNTSRMLSRSGFLGPLTPLATQFFKYTAMLNETLYREVHKAVGGDAEAAKFLAGHLAMTTVFAGALGLPFATVMASAYDRLHDLFDQGDQPSDIMASFRNGLADMFGKDAAEIIARGTPRAAGIDLSTRVGEQDILPFSKFIADRRDLKDSLKDLESRAWGAPSSMMLNMATGAQRVAQGDLVGGFRQMLPLGLSGLVKAYQMTDKGYTDSKGNVLPMTPSAQAILSQAVGFNPAQNAEYNEARGDQMVRVGLLQRQSALLRNQIASAMIDGDQDKARELVGQAIEFDRANPAYGVLRGVEGSIKRRKQSQAIAAQTGVPLGINPKDFNAPQFTRYANVDYAPQQ